MRIVLTFVTLIILSGCATLPNYVRDVVSRMSPDLRAQQAYVGDPVFIRIFKEENILELWMQPENSYTYKLVKTYPICKWSGRLGPKFREGDRQAPEGFYATDLQNLNPNSQYHLSFNMQFPNAFDRHHGRTGSFLMIHGGCRSEGCYAMTDPMIEEIYVLVEHALLAGQTEVPIHVFPFKMTADRLAVEGDSRHFNFWLNLRVGYDYFENYGIPPKWDVINGRYDFY